MITAALFLLILNKEKLEKNIGLLKMKRARLTALDLLESASKYIDRGDLSDAANAIYRALTSYAADKARLSPQEVTGKTAGSVLNTIPGIEASTREEYLRLFHTCTMMKFSTSHIVDINMLRDLRDGALKIVNDMESSWVKNQ